MARYRLVNGRLKRIRPPIDDIALNRRALRRCEWLYDRRLREQKLRQQVAEKQRAEEERQRLEVARIQKEETARQWRQSQNAGRPSYYEKPYGAVTIQSDSTRPSTSNSVSPPWMESWTRWAPSELSGPGFIPEGMDEGWDTYHVSKRRRKS